MARDGIEPPTPAFSGPRAGLVRFAQKSRSAAPGTLDCWKEVVARDGIEPPTPAFSGPRSTTELSGLSANFRLHLYAWIPDEAGEGGKLHVQCSATTQTVYQLSFCEAKPGAKPGMGWLLAVNLAGRSRGRNP